MNSVKSLLIKSLNWMVSKGLESLYLCMVKFIIKWVWNVYLEVTKLLKGGTI